MNVCSIISTKSRRSKHEIGEKWKENKRESETDLNGISELRWSSNNFHKWMSMHTQIIQITIANCTFLFHNSLSLVARTLSPIVAMSVVQTVVRCRDFRDLCRKCISKLYNFPLQPSCSATFGFLCQNFQVFNNNRKHSLILRLCIISRQNFSALLISLSLSLCAFKPMFASDSRILTSAICVKRMNFSTFFNGNRFPSILLPPPVLFLLFRSHSFQFQLK